jgi:DNA polymerase-3 subunit chi
LSETPRSARARGAQRVDFYVLAGHEEPARLKLACRLAEKAYLAGQRVFVRVQDAAQLASFDELLWSFADRSFVPHEPYSEPQQWQDTAVLLGYQHGPQVDYDVLLNLGGEVSTEAEWAARIVEIVDADESRRQAGRVRFRSYRERGLNPQTHHIAAGPEP